jgi:hypothetical protein
VVELAVDELARQIRDETEARLWAEAAADPAFRSEATDIGASFEGADRETWPRE